jgi:hypothetical protein
MFYSAYPILGSVNPGNDLKKVIEDSNAGFVVIAGEDEKFLEWSIKLMDQKIRDTLSKNAKLRLPY